eukprot:796540-Prymnesium_polylepis.1
MGAHGRVARHMTRLVVFVQCAQTSSIALCGERRWWGVVQSRFQKLRSLRWCGGRVGLGAISMWAALQPRAQPLSCFGLCCFGIGEHHHGAGALSAGSSATIAARGCATWYVTCRWWDLSLSTETLLKAGAVRC